MSPHQLLAAGTRRLRERHDDERGAYAILISLLLILVIAFAAISVDIARQVESKQGLKDTMDAVAHTGAIAFGDPSLTMAQVVTQTRNAAISRGHRGDLGVETWCVVGVNESGGVRASDIPAMCTPGFGPPYDTTKSQYRGLVCDASRCFIPCRSDLPGFNGRCNTVRVVASKDVEYKFAPAIGFDKGNTGAVISMACRGACGQAEPNPLDVAIVADRTASLSSSDRAAMKLAILNSLKIMNTSMHHVAFGTLHKSRGSGFTSSAEFVRPEAPVTPAYEDCSKYQQNGRYERQRVWVSNRYGSGSYEWRDVWVSDGSIERCRERNKVLEDAHKAAMKQWEDENTAFPKRVGWDGTGDTNGDGKCASEAVRLANFPGKSAAETRSEGTWVPVGLRADYLVEGGGLNPNSPLVDAISCLGESASGEYGTNLASSFKGAARYLLSNQVAPGAAPRPSNVQKVIIFQTDGQPDEVGSAGGSTSLSNSGDVFGGQQQTTPKDGDPIGNGSKGCQNFLDVAAAAKRSGIRVITIGFGGANSAGCERHYQAKNERLVRDVLAEAASPAASGNPSMASDCSTDQGIQIENSDGDNFFCAAKGDELASVFTTALTSVAKGIKLLKLPS